MAIVLVAYTRGYIAPEKNSSYRVSNDAITLTDDTILHMDDI